MHEDDNRTEEATAPMPALPPAPEAFHLSPAVFEQLEHGRAELANRITRAELHKVRLADEERQKALANWHDLLQVMRDDLGPDLLAGCETELPGGFQPTEREYVAALR